MVGCYTTAEIIPIRGKCVCGWTPREMLDGEAGKEPELNLTLQTPGQNWYLSNFI
jgi:hypothetical protein